MQSDPPPRVELDFTDLPVAAVLADSRGKLLASTAAATTLLRQAPELVTRIATLAALGHCDVHRHHTARDHWQLTPVTDRSAEQDGRRVVFITEVTTEEPSTDPLAVLTPRQRSTAVLAATGLRNAEIATRLGCRERTIRAHLGACYRRVGVRSRTELAALLVRSTLSGASSG